MLPSRSVNERRAVDSVREEVLLTFGFNRNEVSGPPNREEREEEKGAGGWNDEVVICEEGIVGREEREEEPEG